MSQLATSLKQKRVFVPLIITIMESAETLPINWLLFLPVVISVILVIIAFPRLIGLLLGIRELVISAVTKEIYKKIVEPDKELLPSIALLIIADIILLLTGNLAPQRDFIDLIEFPVGLSVALVIGWLGYQLFERYFKIYITELTLSKNKINEDLLIAAKWLVFLLFSFILVTIFSQTHQINILGLIASLGVGGVAIAFAAQKTLEQLLGGIVIYLDRPFVVDDYVGLPDGTFGKVESIGLRSTKIRTTGKGTLMVVPNNYLTGINIENFTGASKVINVTKINFSEHISETKKAFIRQLILEASKSTEIDSRNMSVNFQDLLNGKGEKITQGQVQFLIPSSGELSQEFRLQIIRIIGENIQQKLLEKGIDYEIVDLISINSQISI